MNQRHKITNQSASCSKKNGSSEAGCDKNHPPVIPLVKPTSSQYFEVYATDGINHDMRERYTEAIDYVNFCHRIMNRLLRKKCSESGDAEEYLYDFKIPETANFLSVLDILLHNTKKDVESVSKLNNSNNVTPSNVVKSLNNTPRIKPCGPQVKQTKTLQSHRCQNYFPRDAPQSKVTNNNCKKVPAKPGNLAKSLLQNKIKQCNVPRVGSPNKVVDRNNATQNAKTKLDHGNERRANSSSCEEDDSVRTVRHKTEVQGTNLEDRTLSPLPDPDKNNNHGDNSDLDKYLITIIQKQIQDFLKSSKDNQHAAYVKDKKDCLDIDNFKITNNVHEIDLQNYTTYDEITVQKELEEISKHLSASSSNDSQSTYDYKQCVCMGTEKNCTIAENEIVTSSISVKDLRKAESDDYPLRRVDYTAPNITSSSIMESKRPVKRISTKPTLMNIATNSDTADDGSSSIASDEEIDSIDCKLKCHQKFPSSSSRQEPIKNVDKVKNAFNIPKKHKMSTHISKLKSSDNQDFTHPLNINKREINNLDKNALSQMGLFTETGEIKPNVLSLLQEQSKSNQNNERSRVFRKCRTQTDQVKKKNADPVIDVQDTTLSIASISCASSSDIRSDM